MIASIVLSSIAALAAILAPLLTAFLNNRHNLKIKNIEVFYQHKFEIYKNFSQAYGSIKFHSSLSESHNFFEISHEVMLLGNNEIRNHITLLNRMLLDAQGRCTDGSDSLFSDCCELLHNDLQNTVKTKKH